MAQQLQSINLVAPAFKGVNTEDSPLAQDPSFAEIADNAVISYSPDGEVVRVEHAVEGGNDGVVVLDDGTKYVSSVRFGSVSRIRPGEGAEIIASGVPSAASMCYDSTQHQLVIPLNPNYALAFIPL